MGKIRCIGVIPVRMKSTRLPGKPLKDIAGKSLVRRVWERAALATQLSDVVIATEDQEIVAHAESFGARVLLTRSDHLTGSDRVAEVMQRLREQGVETQLIANIQGDMPFINPEVIDRAVTLLAEAPETVGMSTVATPISSYEDFIKPSVVKVVVGEAGTALYFSRAPIPFWREPSEVEYSAEAPVGLKHMGLYVFRTSALERLAKLPAAMAEKREKLEQLRALCGGIEIRVAVVPESMVQPSIEVDTPEDLARAIAAA